jgi:hypothetical protein
MGAIALCGAVLLDGATILIAHGLVRNDLKLGEIAGSIDANRKPIRMV